ncbi:thymidine phosphorylase [Denticeps clupeoides]|uniref:Thymidine phosphorylase n=1 Tax=Denticeps clupeoides TaxID=299321 RepID=A0AAY4D714_9TELE|nr:thymidine phosphorylase [Denticeps clupeoides]XP_028811426.1 thymidine phosphorylase [Denticeps clupeoides]
MSRTERGDCPSFPDLIRRKRDGGRLSAADIRAFVQAVKCGSIQDGQIGAMLMAIWHKGMEPDETLALTEEMMRSGDILTWPQEWSGLVVDKHSTGGVGDKVSLPLAPALAACGCKVPMISGRGLAHTGGTLDKLESIRGFTVDQPVERLQQILEDVGCCIVGQTESLVPADRALYAMRDATATVDSMPLITGSILSKKGAEGLSALVLDVKFGRAALYKNIDSARDLAHSLVTVGNSIGMRTGAVLSRMDTPIGCSVGNSLEVCEALECLKGRGPSDLQELVKTLGGYLLWMSGRASSLESGQEKLAEVLQNGAALQKFQAMLQAQGVSMETAQSLCSVQSDYSLHFRQAEHQTELKVQNDGMVLDINGLTLAEVLHSMGAGRTKAGQPINHSVGAEILVRLGQNVQTGDPWLRIHYDSPALNATQCYDLQAALTVGERESYHANPRVAEFILPR